MAHCTKARRRRRLRALSLPSADVCKNPRAHSVPIGCPPGPPLASLASMAGGATGATPGLAPLRRGRNVGGGHVHFPPRHWWRQLRKGVMSAMWALARARGRVSQLRQKKVRNPTISCGSLHSCHFARRAPSSARVVLLAISDPPLRARRPPPTASLTAGRICRTP